MWESSGFNECANNNVLAASDGSGGSRDTPKNLRRVAFGVATFSLQILSDTSFKLQHTGFLRGQVPGRQTVPRAEPSFGEPSKSSAESTKRRISKFRLMRSMWREVSHTGVSWNRGQMAYDRFPPHACKLFGRCCGRGGSETFAIRRESGTQSQKRQSGIGVCVAKRLSLVQADIWAKHCEAGVIYELDPLLEVEEACTRSAVERLVGELAH